MNSSSEPAGVEEDLAPPPRTGSKAARLSDCSTMLALHVALLRLADLLGRCSFLSLVCLLGVMSLHATVDPLRARLANSPAKESIGNGFLVDRGADPDGMLFCPMSVHAIYEFRI